ncbi:MAG: prepilin-type N-terminal cleavage/methylation domain-containing protein [Candidatus Rokubacteria bacterium]|nr:prepilin-type N-terminal cleavage/methylation domain-containing protein [Candidatus Rokubacteria bacterium]
MSRSKVRGKGSGASGFTLLEVVIVLAVLAVIGAILAPMAYQLLVAERASAVEDELQAIYQAVVGNPEKGIFGYVGDVAKYPASLVDLVAVSRDANGIPMDAKGNQIPGWRGPYLQNVRLENGLHTDPLNRPYEYFLVPVDSGVGNKFAVISRGLDGVSTNTADNPNFKDNYTGPAPTDPTYTSDHPENVDNAVFPKPTPPNPGAFNLTNPEALNVIVSGDVALNILNFDNNPKVNAFVPACPQLFNVTATSVARKAVEADLPYVQGLTVDLVQGQYSTVITPQDQRTVSWTETLTVLPAATLTRTLNLTGLDSSGTPLFNLVVANKFSATNVEVLEFDTKLKSTDNKTKVNAGETKTFTPHGCGQIYIKATGDSKIMPKNAVVDQFVMPYGHFTRNVGTDAANVTIVNRVEKRLKVFRNKILIGTVPRGDVHDDEGKKHPHIKTKTFKDLMAGDLVEVTDKDLILLASLILAAGDNTLTVQ